MIRKPATILCDVNGTLFKLDALGDRLEKVGLPKDKLQLWFARTLRDGKALAITDTFATFKDVAGFQLKAMLSEQSYGGPDRPSKQQLESAAATVLGGFDEVEAWPDVALGFQKLRQLGVEIATMTNGSTEVTQKFLERSDLSQFVAECMEVAEVQLWKPRAEVYLHAAKRLGLQPDQVMLAAVHPWDTHGAKAAGLQAAYINRDGADYPPYFLPPDANLPSFVALAEHLTLQ